MQLRRYRPANKEPEIGLSLALSCEARANYRPNTYQVENDSQPSPWGTFFLCFRKSQPDFFNDPFLVAACSVLRWAWNAQSETHTHTALPSEMLRQTGTFSIISNLLTAAVSMYMHPCPERPLASTSPFLP